jgi:SAM-dependent methyltransferase
VNAAGRFPDSAADFGSMGGSLAREGNRKVYAASKVVDEYRARGDLYPAEAAILSLLDGDLGGMSVLDIGVGGGRTALHLMDRAREYVGIDYAEPMVAACRTRFPQAPQGTFRTGDVRRLDFPDARFDFVFFSYNGLDYIGHEDRTAALREMRRVGRPGSRMALSTHNLLSFGRERGERDRGLGASLRRTALRAAVRLINGNPETLRGREYAVVRDDGCGFRLRTYYVNPAAMIRSLERAGFRETRLFGVDGREMSREEAASAADPFIHYLSLNP